CWRALTLFLLSSFCSQPLESLQPFQTWLENAMTGKASSACRGHTAAYAFLIVQLQCPDSRVISQPSCVAKNATLLVCLMPVEGLQDAGQLTVATRCRAFRLASVGGHLRFSF